MIIAAKAFARCLLAGLFAMAFLASACLPQPVPTRSYRAGRAEVQVYLQPIPPEAGRLQWTLDDLSAVRSDGTRVSLNLKAGHFKGYALTGRQFHLATGYLPPGSYSGITLTIGEASLTREDGEAALLVPESPLYINGPFELGPSEVLPLFLKLLPTGLVDGGFAFSPDFSLALPAGELTSLIGYLTIPDGDRIMVFNRKTLRITGAVTTGRTPLGMAIDTRRGRGYIAVSDDDVIQVLDTLRGDIREKITLRTGDGPRDLALTGDGRILLSANYTSGTVSVIDPIQGVETERIEVGRGPTSVIVNESGTRAFTTCSLSGTLSVIDLTNGTLSASLTLEETTPLAAAFDREEENLFVVCRDSANLTVMDPASLAVKNKIFVGIGSVSIVVDSHSGLVFVGRSSASEISLIDPSVLMPVDFIRLKGAPGHMAIDPLEKALLVIIPGKRVLQKVDLVSKRVMAEMKLDLPPSEVAVFE